MDMYKVTWIDKEGEQREIHGFKTPEAAWNYIIHKIFQTMSFQWFLVNLSQ